MTDDSAKKDDSATGGLTDPANWSTGAKVGAAVGSAALLAALLYAGRYAMKGRIEPQSPGDGDHKTPMPPPGEQFESD